MGIFSKRKRLKTEKDINEYILERMKELAEIKKSAAEVMAEEVKQERKVIECEVQIERFGDLAEKAVAAGSEEDARVFLKRKYELMQQLETFKTNHQQVAESAEKIRQSHDALVKEINDLRQRMELLKTKEAAANAQETVYGGRRDVDEALDDWETSSEAKAARAEAKEYASKSEEELLSEEIERLRKRTADADGE